MARWLILQQTCSETPGNILYWMKKYQQRFQIVQLWHQNPPADWASYSGLILMGGTMCANDVEHYPFLREEMRLIEYWLKQKKPLLGICLGAQLLAKTLGSRVFTGERPEIGWYSVALTSHSESDPLFSFCNGEQMVFQWHYDTFDLPEGSTLLASSPAFPHQAFRYGDSAYGVQFHPEMDSSLIRSWVTLHEEALFALNPALPQKILADTNRYIEALESFGERLFTNFFKLLPEYVDKT